MLEQAVQVLQRCGCRALPVEHNGELVGMLTLENVGEFMMIHSAMRRAEHASHVSPGNAKPDLEWGRWHEVTDK